MLMMPVHSMQWAVQEGECACSGAAMCAGLGKRMKRTMSENFKDEGEGAMLDWVGSHCQSKGSEGSKAGVKSGYECE